MIWTKQMNFYEFGKKLLHFLTRRIRLWTQIQILRLRTRKWSSVIWRNYICNLGKTAILHHPTIMSQSERNHLNLNKPDATSEMQMYRSQAKYRGVIPFFIKILVEILSSWYPSSIALVKQVFGAKIPPTVFNGPGFSTVSHGITGINIIDV